MTLSSLTTATVQIPFSQIFSLFVESIACQVVFFDRFTLDIYVGWNQFHPQNMMQFYDIILKRKAHFNYSRTFLLEEKKPQDFFLFVPKVISFDQSLTKTLIHSILNGIQYSGTPCNKVFSTASSKIYIS